MTKKRKNYKHLSEEERYIIYEMRLNKKSMQLIADCLGRAKSTISNEISRDKTLGKYMPCTAHAKYQKRLCKSDICKIDQDFELFGYIYGCMVNKKWFPDVIAGRIKLENNLPNISAETIYNYVYNSDKARKLQLYKYLPRKQMSRLKQGSRKRKKISIPNRVSVHQRPKIAVEKTELGHFEGDLTFHKGNQSMNIGAIVDKMSQRIFLTLNHCKRTLTVTTEFLKRIKSISPELRKSLTLDNGKEFTGHTAFNLLGLKTYFCDAHSPGQKPLVEKMNSMIHRICPKKTDIKTLTKRKLLKIENILNNMPRKNLNYKTPNEIWNEQLAKQLISA